MYKKIKLQPKSKYSFYNGKRQMNTKSVKVLKNLERSDQSPDIKNEKSEVYLQLA